MDQMKTKKGVKQGFSGSRYHCNKGSLLNEKTERTQRTVFLSLGRSATERPCSQRAGQKKGRLKGCQRGGSLSYFAGRTIEVEGPGSAGGVSPENSPERKVFPPN